MNKKIFIVVVVILLVILIFLLKKGKKKEITKPPVFVETQMQIIETPTIILQKEKPEIKKIESKIKDYKFDVIKKTDDKKVFKVEKQGKELLIKEAGAKANFIFNPDGKNKNLPQIGEDVTGDGKPDMILQLKSEKDSCANIFSIFSIEEDFKIIAELKGLAEGIKFKDLDEDGIPEIIGNDCTFLNWWASFGENLAPQIILKNKYGDYRLADGLMRKIPPNQQEMENYIKKNKGGFITYIWKYMLDLIYSGNGDMAWAFYEKVEWDSDWEEQIVDDKNAKKISDKKEFLEAFKEHLTTSPYWEDLKRLNGWEMLEVEM